MRYPKDQLELFLIMPPQRPVPFEAIEGQQGAKIVQFDVGLDWDDQEASWEGLNLARGEYVQILHGQYGLEPHWIQEALPYFLHHQIYGVRGRIEGEPEPQRSRAKSPGSPVELTDGLYDRKIINYLRMRKELIGRSRPNHFPVPEKILTLSRTMAVRYDAGRAFGFPQANNPFRRLVRRLVQGWAA